MNSDMEGTKDIKNFTKFPSLSDDDLLLGSKTSLGGTDASITVVNFKKQVVQDVKPSIVNGYWWVDNINTGVLATGRTPKFRKTSAGLEMKYEDQDDTAYILLIPMSDLAFTFDDLSPEQVEELKLKFSDLTDADKEALRGKAFTYDMFTPEQLADLRLTWDKLTPEQKNSLKGDRGYSAFEVWTQQEGNAGKIVDDYLAWLRQPATDAAKRADEKMVQISEEVSTELTNMRQLEATVSGNEEIRETSYTQWQAAEQGRQNDELKRKEAEALREAAEELRDTAESTRNAKETDRQAAEVIRQNTEKSRVEEETKRAAAEDIRNQTEQLRSTEEGKRIEEEKKRVAAETLRNQSEINRDNAEKLRDEAETLRAAEEVDRDNAEQVRIAEEGKRDIAEKARAAAEAERQKKEGERIIEEQLRKTAEVARQENETTRQTQEEQREQGTVQAILNAEEATGKANTAAILANEKAGLADAAAGNADTAAGKTSTAITNAENATKAANDAASAANAAKKNADDATGKATSAADLATEKAGLASAAATAADTAKDNAVTATGNANTATDRANAAAENAENIVKGFQSDWNVADPSDPNYIKNKPEIPTLASAPGADTLSYVNAAGTTVNFRIGDEVRVLEDGEYVFYKLYDLAGGVASWQEAGSGTALPGNIYLQGANYYNDSVIIIKEGYIQ